MTPRETYDQFFAKYGANVHNDPERMAAIAALCKGSVLDVGCGTGTLADYYRGEYVGYDVSAVAIRSAIELRRKDAQFYCGDFTEKECEPLGQFDTVVLCEFLEHIENDDEVLRKVVQHLKPNGRLVVGVPNGERVPDADHVREFTVPQLRAKFAEIGRVQFHVWGGFRERILLSVERGEENRKEIALGMFAKNEEKGLETAILSCLQFVDRVVIAVDSLSDDGTFEIAKRYADEVKILKWSNSFAAARNFVQENIGTEWTLALDGHEFVEKADGVREALKDGRDGLHVKVVLENGFEFYFARLVKSRIKWEHDVHNAPMCKTYGRFEGLVIRHDRANLQSEKSREARNKQRDEMIVGIFSKELAKDRKNVRAAFYLAQHFMFEQKLDEALRYYKQYLRYSKNKEERWLVLWQVATIHMMKGREFRAWLAITRAEREVPERWETKFTLAMIWGLVDNPVKMARLLVDAMLPNKRVHLYSPIERDLGMMFDYLGVALARCGKNEEAKTAWQLAVEYEKQKPEGKQNKRRLKILEQIVR